MNHLDELKMGPEGELTKLERACDVLQFLRKTYAADNKDLQHQILETENEV